MIQKQTNKSIYNILFDKLQNACRASTNLLKFVPICKQPMHCVHPLSMTVYLLRVLGMDIDAFSALKIFCLPHRTHTEVGDIYITTSRPTNTKLFQSHNCGLCGPLTS